MKLRRRLMRRAANAQTAAPGRAGSTDLAGNTCVLPDERQSDPAACKSRMDASVQTLACSLGGGKALAAAV